MKREELDNLLYEALETEQGGVKIYETPCVRPWNEDLREEWEEYLEQTRRHVQIVEEVFEPSAWTRTSRRPGARW
jgi:rubrerythrin